ncbi:hypothetical protein AB0E25_41260 [Streptomyces bobili]|uniref:hypothetical protein n=1 Tax=Streptomyces bobili TaxID=67280 RepID=UPI0033F7E90E
MPANNNEKILHRVVGNDAFDVTSHLAATDMANDIRNNRIDGTLHDNHIFGKEGRGDRRNPVTIAAEPDTSVDHRIRSAVSPPSPGSAGTAGLT